MFRMPVLPAVLWQVVFTPKQQLCLWRMSTGEALAAPKIEGDAAFTAALLCALLALAFRDDGLARKPTIHWLLFVSLALSIARTLPQLLRFGGRHRSHR